jgi:hypothetical protein
MPLAVAACILAVLLQTAAVTPPSVRLRFHHVHVLVGDPASESRVAAARLGGTRTILQGHGLSVRAGQEYVVFDRDGAESSSAEDAFQRAVAWATAHGLTIEPSTVASAALRDAVGSARVGTVAFTSTDPTAAVAVLAGKGLVPVERRDDVARFEVSKSLTLEIIAETDRPDTHWCPMHPDVRASGAARCSVCGMELVPIPPPRIGEYRLDVEVAPGATKRGIAGLRLRVVDPETNGTVTSFLDVHEKTLHLFILSRSLEFFAHVHPQQHDDGSFALDQELPEGEYMLVADFLPASGTPQMVQRAIVTPGYAGRLFGAATPQLTSLEQIVDGVRVRMEILSLRPGRRSVLRFVLSHAASGAPIRDLELYLGAPGHLLAIDTELRAAIHGHPEAQSLGSEVVFDPVLPAAGRYKLWVQFQRNGRVVTAPFVIDVPES